MDEVHTLKARVHTGSSRRDVVEKHDGLHIYTCRKPVNGEANLDVLQLLSEYFKVPKSSVSIVRGERSREKLFRIAARVEGEKSRYLT